MFVKTLINVLLVGAAMASVALGQQQREGTSGTIGRMDSVEIRVFREDDLTTRGQLSADGTVSMPLIGAVRIEGLTTDQAAAAISRKLRAGYLVRPEVSVSIEARIRKTVTILGQAQRPGVFEIPAHRSLTLVEAIGMAGGMTRIANDKKITVKRGSQVLTVNLRDVTTGKGNDMSLRNGDVVNIPESLF